MSFFVCFFALEMHLLVSTAISLILNLNHSHLPKGDISNWLISYSKFLGFAAKILTVKKVLLNFHEELGIGLAPPSWKEIETAQWSVRGDAEISHLKASLIRLVEINQKSNLEHWPLLAGLNHMYWC